MKPQLEALEDRLVMDAAVMVADYYLGGASSNPAYLTNVNDKLYFAATVLTGELDIGRELGKYDPVSGQTTFYNIAPDQGGQVKSSNPMNLANINGMLFFSADNGTNGRELYKLDALGNPFLFNLADDQPNVPPISSNPRDFTNVNGTLYFVAYYAPAQQNALWMYKPTDNIPNPVVDRNNLLVVNPGNLIAAGGKLFFTRTASDMGAAKGNELWVSDGTAAGTKIAADINPGAGSSIPMDLVVYHGDLYFSAASPDANGFLDRELWKYGIATEQAYQVWNVDPAANTSSNPMRLTVSGDWLYFAATETAIGTELFAVRQFTVWGIEQHTTTSKDIDPNGNGDPRLLTDVGGTLFFAGTDNLGQELWKASVVNNVLTATMVKDIAPGANSSQLENFFSFDNKLYFAAIPDPGNPGGWGHELWWSDGTAEGTTFQDINLALGQSSSPGFFAIVGDYLYFQANNGVNNGTELWRKSRTII